ncbi:hypothetical protein C1H46_037660 [Malus baccata]|uniref:Uncharacterized protein n=1 Tax=Malus baccata TaxID=106549 RepID=A0A540KRG3_MALBA|nr:hypothetical protein C1H46_037660 [Malus baccata]
MEGELAQTSCARDSIISSPPNLGPVNDDGKNFQCPPSLKSLDGTFTVAYVDILSGQSGQSLSTGSNNIIPVCQCILNPYTFRKHELLSMLDNQQKA